MHKLIGKLTLIIYAVVFISISTSAQNKDVHAVKGHQPHWSYSGNTGPEHWSELDPEYSLCNGGREQSPVDFRNTEISKLDNIKFLYKSSPIDLINNGHTIQENVAQGSSSIIGGKIFQLIQFHFHTPSEHTVNGKHYAMEMHLVQKSDDGGIAVVGIFFKKGKFNKDLQIIIDNLPKGINNSSINKSASINIGNFLPLDKTYFHYFGSLTTPPCSEQINWNVFKAPLEASAKQIDTLKAVMGNNSRPVQKLNKRFVLESK